MPKLPADGRGLVVQRGRLELSIEVRGLFGHLDRTTVRPDNPGSKTLTVEEVSLVDKYTKDLNQYLLEQAVVFSR